MTERAEIRYDDRNINIQEADELKSLSPKDRLIHFAAYGALAPTSHNTSPEKFQVTEDKLTILLDRSLVLPASDREGRQATVSIGCVAENISQAAQAYGLTPTVEFLDSDKSRTLYLPEADLVPMLSFTFQGEIQSPDKDQLQAMLERQVNRAEYDKTVKLPKEIKNQLETALTNYNLKIHLIESRLVLLALGEFQERADNVVIQNQEFRNELSQWFLLNSAQAKRGMRGSEFGLSDEATQNFHEGLNGKRQLLPSELAGFAKTGKTGISSASAIAVITIPEDTVESRINAGMAYEKIALILQQKGFSTAMHAALSEQSFTLIKPFSKMLQARLATKQIPTVIFRIGIPKWPEDKKRSFSFRPSISELLV